MEGAILLTASLTDRLLRAVEPAPVEPHNPAVAALLLEFALADALDALEAASRVSIALSAFEMDATAPAGCVEVGLAGSLAGSREDDAEDVDFQAILMLPEALLRMARGLIVATLPPDLRIPLPPAMLAVRIGIVRLPVSLVASLRPGDAIIPDVSLAPDAALLVIGERLAARVRVDATRLVLEDRPLPITAECREWIVPSGKAGSEDDYSIMPEDADLGELQVILVFELGRRTIRLAEVRELAPGHVLELGPIGDATVSVLANGRRIGQGELVQVGDAIAIRLSSVSAGG